MQYPSIIADIPGDTCEITLTDVKGEHHFSSGNIVRLEAADNYTVVHFTTRRPFVVSKVLKTYEQLLTPYGFVRTHRSHLVNKQYVKSIANNRVLMQDASVAELAKRKRNRILHQLTGSLHGVALSGK